MRYLRLYFSFFKINLQRALAYRANFFFGLIITAIESAAVFMTVGVLFLHVPDINGWTYPEMLVLTGIFMLANSFSWLIFRSSVEQLDRLISRGDFDFYLVKPISSQFLASVNRIDVEDSTRGLVGIGLIGLGFWKAEYVPNFMALIGFLIAFACGEAILYALQITLKTISFKSIQGWGSNNVFYRLQETSQFPLTIYRGFARVLYTAIIPIFFVTTVPAQLLLGKVSLVWIGWALLAATCALLAARAIWSLTIKTYSSASS